MSVTSTSVDAPLSHTINEAIDNIDFQKLFNKLNELLVGTGYQINLSSEGEILLSMPNGETQVMGTMDDLINILKGAVELADDFLQGKIDELLIENDLLTA